MTIAEPGSVSSVNDKENEGISFQGTGGFISSILEATDR